VWLPQTVGIVVAVVLVVLVLVDVVTPGWVVPVVLVVLELLVDVAVEVDDDVDVVDVVVETVLLEVEVLVEVVVEPPGHSQLAVHCRKAPAGEPAGQPTLPGGSHASPGLTVPLPQPLGGQASRWRVLANVPVMGPVGVAQSNVPLAELASADTLPAANASVVQVPAVVPLTEKVRVVKSIVPVRCTAPTKSQIPVMSRLVPDWRMTSWHVPLRAPPTEKETVTGPAMLSHVCVGVTVTKWAHAAVSALVSLISTVTVHWVSTWTTGAVHTVVGWLGLRKLPPQSSDHWIASPERPLLEKVLLPPDESWIGPDRPQEPPVQTPPWHSSWIVVESESSHGVPMGAGTRSQVSAASSQSACRHWSPGHVRGVSWTQWPTPSQ
jgi:hypothetical protein